MTEKIGDIIENTEKKQRKAKSLKNLKPFKPGQSGNPAGRPKGSISIKDKIRQHLENNPDEVEEIVRHFVKNNRELMWQMLEGRPSQDVGVTGELVNKVELTDEQLTRLIRQRARKLDSGNNSEAVV